MLSDYNWEAAKTLGLYAEDGADLHELLAGYSPANTRGSFLIDQDAILRYAWRAPEVLDLPDPQALLDAVKSL